MVNLKKINILLDQKIKKNFFFIVFFNFLISTLEFLSVASIYPALLIITNSTEDSKLDKLFSFFQIDISNKSLNFFLILILIFIIFKNVFSIFLNWYIHTFLLKNYDFISKVTLNKMLKFNYLDVINLSSPIFIRNSKEIVLSFRNYLTSLILISTEIVMVLSLFFILAIISLKITLISSFALLVFLSLILKISKHRISTLGKLRNEGFANLNKSLIEIFNSFRELKIYKNLNFYLKTYNKHNLDFARAQRNIEFFIGITKNLFELLVIIFIAILIHFSNFQINLEVLPKIGIFTYAFFRLYPSFTKISTLKTMINSNENSVDILIRIQKQKTEKEKISNKKNKGFKFDNILEIKNLSFGYDKNLIFKNLNLNIRKGSIIGISGKNGSGKTTLCNIILSLIEPNSGKILIDKKYDIKENLSNYRSKVSFIPQNIFLLNDSIENNITFNVQSNEIDNSKLLDVINITGLKKINELVNTRHNSFIGENGSNLSGGQRQRIAIARALYRNSEIIVMDEHTSALDSSTEEKLLTDMKKLFNGKTIIIISHKKKVLEYCDINYSLENGILKKLKNNLN